MYLLFKKEMFFSSQLLVSLPEGIPYPRRKKMAPEKSSNRRGLPNLTSGRLRRDPPASSRRLWDDWHSHVPGEQRCERGREESMSPGKKKLRRLNTPRPSIFINGWFPMG